jgi:hypothetical protein
LEKTSDDSESNPLSLSQQAYVIARSLSEIINVLAILMGGMAFYFFVGIFVEDPLSVLLIVLIVFSPFLIFMLIKSRQFSRELNIWNEQYLQNSYILIFDTTTPKGNSTGERVLNLTRLIFPQLRRDYINYYYVSNFVRFFLKKIFAKSWDKILSESLNYRINQELSLDVALKTLEGYFIVKDFKDHIVTTEDLAYLLDVVSRKFRKKNLRPNIFRIIVVAKEFDRLFYDRKSLEQIMKKMVRKNSKTDLIIEEQKGYSVLWIS